MVLTISTEVFEGTKQARVPPTEAIPTLPDREPFVPGVHRLPVSIAGPVQVVPAADITPEQWRGLVEQAVLDGHRGDPADLIVDRRRGSVQERFDSFSVAGPTERDPHRLVVRLGGKRGAWQRNLPGPVGAKLREALR